MQTFGTHPVPSESEYVFYQGSQLTSVHAFIFLNSRRDCYKSVRKIWLSQYKIANNWTKNLEKKLKGQ